MRHPDQFQTEAITLYRARHDELIAEIADEIGVNRETQRSWIHEDDAERSEVSAPVQRPRTQVTNLESDVPPEVKTREGRQVQIFNILPRIL